MASETAHITEPPFPLLCATNFSPSFPELCHTQNLYLYGTEAIEFSHALNFCETDKVTTLKSMLGLLQADDDPWTLLVGVGEEELIRAKPHITRHACTHTSMEAKAEGSLSIQG